MLDRIHEFREKLHSGKKCLGCGITLSDASVTEALGQLVDFFWVDLEHTHLGLESLLNHLIAARAIGRPALVRVPTSDVASIKPVLDMGADGIITPQVKSADEVRQVVQHCRYKPIGDRGHGPRRASDYGNYGGGVEYAAAANDGIFVVVQIERADALADLDNILAVDGYDSLAIGPSDLAASMGHTGNYNHPEVQKALETIIRKSLAAGKFIGSGMGPEAQFAQHLFGLGAQWIQCGDDFGYMMKYCAQLYSSIRNFDR